MARATTGTAKTAKRRPVAPVRGVTKPAAKVLPTSKEELRARIEKLERANANLRVKNKEFRRIAEETAERLEALQVQIESSDRKAARFQKRENGADLNGVEAGGAVPPDKAPRAKRVPRKIAEMSADASDDDAISELEIDVA